MKKLLQFTSFVLGLILILFGVNAYMNHSSGAASSDTLTIYNWGDYIDPDI